MNQCGKNEFGCNDGSCIPMEKRCNEMTDCTDTSDENECHTVDINTDRYRKEKPPVELSSNVTSVSVNISVISLCSFEELAMTFKARIKVYNEY
jgi:hypothetical protein